MTPERLQELLAQIEGTRVAVIGDFCVDAYWLIDMALSEVSVETGKDTRPVRQQYYSLGGAGNIVTNLAALDVEQIYAVGVIGDDLWGREMIRLMQALGVDASGMQVQAEGWSTPVYAKPHIGEQEQERHDFGVYNLIAEETEQAVLKALAKTLPNVQTVIVNQQLPRGVQSDGVIAGINDLVAAHPQHVFIVDSRDRSSQFRGTTYRLNGHDAARTCGRELPIEQSVRLEDCKAFAARIAEMSGRPVFVSRGSRGSVVRWEGRTEEIPGIQILKATDAVGAGDTSVSALGAAMAAGATPPEAAELANFASAVTVQKLRTTGTATPKEILDIGSSPDYIYNPELAGDPRAARFLDGTEIEIIVDAAREKRIRYAIFDHDGTISTLRQGWEPIMAEQCLRAILGGTYQTADETVYARVAERVDDYIHRSTGIETIRQMQAVVEMVHEFGYVPAEQILDPYGYKALYLNALMARVNERIAKLDRGELDVGDVTMKGAVAFLQELRRRDVTLYLASGTDHDAMVHEARKLGYADLFDGGIFGASGQIDRDVKKEVIERILSRNGLAGDELACFGDGPVELRETRKHGGRPVGIASDEVRRYGWNPDKRPRLVQAGAHLLIPDFSQADALLAHLFG